MSEKKDAEKSKEACRHLHVMKERICGAQTGDYVCLDCGEKDIAPCDLPKLMDGESRTCS